MNVPPFWSALTISAALGWLLGVMTGWLPLLDHPAEQVYRMPAPWRIQRLPGMGDLRLAMIHDVVHERFLVRSPDWYRARNAKRQVAIDAWVATGADPTTGVLDDFDDLAVGHERLGDSAAAIAVMRRKAALIGLTPPQHPEPLPAVDDAQAQAEADLAAWRARGQLSEADHHRYTTLANLGTALVHGHLPRLLAGDATQRPQVEEGLACLQAAVRLNPAAHLGRETWQIVAIEHLLATQRDPGLRLRFDLIGNPWASGPAPDPGTAMRRPMAAGLWLHQTLADHAGLPERLRGPDTRFGPDWTPEMLDARLSDQGRLRLRAAIATVGADPAWVQAVGPSRRAPAAFDEPVLGILGMWMFGGGANPHFALAIATTCERIGQRQLALEAYLRCVELVGTFRADPAPRERLVEHCQERARILAEALAPGDGATYLVRAQARQRDELAMARERRAAAHASERERLAVGVDPDDETLAASGAALASDPGTADERWSTPDRSGARGDGIACAMIAVAAVAWLWLGGEAIRDRIRRRRGDLSA